MVSAVSASVPSHGAVACAVQALQQVTLLAALRATLGSEPLQLPSRRVQVEGALKSLYMQWRTEIVSCLAHAEAVIDFGEDEDDCNDAVYHAVEGR